MIVLIETALIVMSYLQNNSMLKNSELLSSSDFNGETLVGRTQKYCNSENIHMVKFLFDDTYAKHVKRNNHGTVQDGLVDSIKQILVSGFYDPHLLNAFLSPF